MRYYALMIDGNEMGENYPELRDGCLAYETALLALCATERNTGVRLELVAIDGPPRTERVLVATLLQPCGTFHTDSMKVQWTPEAGFREAA